MSVDRPEVSPALERLVQEAEGLFRTAHGAAPEFLVAAPGRVNLIGEHVDYNDGFVLPMAIDRHTVVAASRKAGRVATVSSSLRPGTVDIGLDGQIAPGRPGWANYVRGVVAGVRATGVAVPGFVGLVHSDVPIGGGLSSSASLEVATCLLLEVLTGRELSLVDRVRLCQKAEHTFAGVPCGIMDQFVVAAAQPDHALMLDCQSLATRQVPLDGSQVALLVTHCGVAHELGKGEYAKRRADCHRAASVLGVPSLRSATLAQLAEADAGLSATERARARHVITEIARATGFASALEAGRWAEAGRLMYASHASLRDDYEVSCGELNLLVDLAAGMGEAKGVWGARLTGGGFGGCTVTLVRANEAENVRQALVEAYRARTGIVAQSFVSPPAAGACVVRAVPAAAPEPVAP